MTQAVRAGELKGSGPSADLVTQPDVNAWFEKRKVPERWPVDGFKHINGDVRRFSTSDGSELPLSRLERLMANESDNPAELAECEMGWWEAEMDASIWWAESSLPAEEAADILCCLNPLNPGAAAEYAGAAMSASETWGNNSKRLLRVFRQIELSEPGSRTLAQWLQVAKAKPLPYHPWIEKWLDAKSRTEDHVNDLPTAAPAESGQPGAGAAQLTEAAEPDTGLSKRERKIRAIEQMADELKLPRMEIPLGGKKKLESACMSRWSALFGAGKDPFKEAWQAALDARRIRTKDHAKYSGK